MKKYYFAIVLLIVIIGMIWYSIARNSPKSTDELIYEKLSSIEYKLDSINSKKDSIRTVVVTIDREILNNTKTHEKVVNTIITQPSSLDSIFARDYIEKFINERVR